MQRNNNFKSQFDEIKFINLTIFGAETKNEKFNEVKN
jgi:hypothetical protein